MHSNSHKTANEIQKISRQLLTHEATRHGPANPSYYKSKLIFLGNIPVAQERKISNDERLYIADEACAWKAWSIIFTSSNVFELKSQALYFANRFKGNLTLDHWKILKNWVVGVENWAHGDSLCSLLAELFEKFPSTLLPTYKRWNKSNKPWERRLSIVGLFYYARSRKIRQPPFSLALQFVKNLFSDDDFYVQKAIGWTLREMYQVYPEKTLAYVFSIAKTLHPLALQATTEKFDKATKNRFMKIRQK